MNEVLPVGRLLRPRSVAIVGASPEQGAIGNNVLVNLERSGFAGALHLVSRNRTEIAGRPCVKTIDDLPEGVDAVVLVVPEAAVEDAVAACVRRKAGSALIFASGFAEAGEEGRAKQARIAAAARAGGLVLAGPNCIGFTNFVDGVALTFEPLQHGGQRVARGAAAIAQSGAMTTNLRLALIAKGIPVSQAISTGNEAVAGIEDFLADALARDETDLFVLFIEQVRRPKLFLELMRRAREKRVPVLMLHPGRTARAREAALTHTGALAGDHAVMTTALESENVLLADTLDELFDAAALIARWPAPPKEGAGIVTNSGAFRGVALDLCAELGLDLPMLAPETRTALKAMLPAYAAIDNPLDITTIGLAQHDIFGKTAQVMLDDPAVGALLGAFIPGSPQLQTVRARSLLPVIEASKKPFAFSLFGDDTPLAPEFVQMVRDAKVPLFRSPDRALRAVARVNRYGQLLARERRAPRSAPLPPLPGRGAIPEYQAKLWLNRLGIACPEGGLARSREEARARVTGFPVALKAQAADLTHKTESGGVILNIADFDALDAAWDRIHENVARTRPGLRLDGILVERQARPQLELIVGARRDPEWGAILMLGLGGIWIEALADVMLVAADSTEDEIEAALGRLKGAALFEGHRGHPPLDKRAVARVASLLGDAICGGDIFDLEINPLAVFPGGVPPMALDALLLTA
jgi:acetate---CoA ligase (ADP-forming)